MGILLIVNEAHNHLPQAARNHCKQEVQRRNAKLAPDQRNPESKQKIGPGIAPIAGFDLAGLRVFHFNRMSANAEKLEQKPQKHTYNIRNNQKQADHGMPERI